MSKEPSFELLPFKGRYIEPFLGSGAVFFHLKPTSAILSDINPRLIEAYTSIRDDYQETWRLLQQHQELHSKEYYYKSRSTKYTKQAERAAQFIYLNRSCWNGLYRENLQGEFNVPIGTKTNILFKTDDFSEISRILKNSKIFCRDFEISIDVAMKGDFVFIDPPYTTAHNFNGFVKYNEKIFSWDDQIRLRDAAVRAANRGACVVVTNADHDSVRDLYKDVGQITSLQRKSIIASSSAKRQPTAELIITVGGRG